MSKVDGGPIDPLPPSRLRVTIFSRRLLGLINVPREVYKPGFTGFKRAIRLVLIFT